MRFFLPEHLLSLDKEGVKKATEHRFLHEVGTFRINSQNLTTWLMQARYFIAGYLKAVGMMITKLPLYQHQREPDDNNPNFDEEHSYYTLRILSKTISYLYDESHFLCECLGQKTDVQEHQIKQQPTTIKYINYVKKVVMESDYDLGEAIVVLWAIQDLFFRAWYYADAQLTLQEKSSVDKYNDTIVCKWLMKNGPREESKALINDFEYLVYHLDTTDPSRLKSFERVYREVLALQVELWDMAYQ